MFDEDLFDVGTVNHTTIRKKNDKFDLKRERAARTQITERINKPLSARATDPVILTKSDDSRRYFAGTSAFKHVNEA
jgi:hypothetical protein